MKLKFLGVLLLVSLMATNGFATNYTWTSTSGGSWATGGNWNTPPASPGLVGDEYRLFTNTMTNAAVISSAVGPYNGRIRVSGGTTSDPTNTAKLNITGGSISIAEFRVGDQGISSSLGSNGLVTQTGGTVTMIASSSGTSYSRNLIIGRGGSSGPVANGKYVISGGTITYDATGAYAGINKGQLLVGASPNVTGATGLFEVDGNSASITMNQLFVGSDDSLARGGTGTMQFDLRSNGISRIVLDSNITLDAMGASSTANLVVQLVSGETALQQDMVLIQQKGSEVVHGLFDGLAEGASIVVGSTTYKLTYLYNAEAGGGAGERGTGNDIALLIPEPATIALLSLGLFAIRRKK